MLSYLKQFVSLSLLLLPVVVAADSVQKYDVDQSTGFRMERYRAPVPEDLPGGITLDNPGVLALHASGEALFIDVYPPKGLGPDPLDGHWVISETRDSIPGAIWLPEVGRGSLQADAIDYFSRNLNRLTQADKTAALVFFCTSDCWQSWNAARRALQLGYSNIYWYPLGSDGWHEAGQSLTRVYPVNFLDDTTPDSGQDAAK